MYCSPKWHNKVDTHFTLDQLKQFWIEIFTKTFEVKLLYKLTLSGGEVTGNKHLLPFLEWLRTEYGDKFSQIVLVSNGSASYKYYSRLLECVDNLSLSFHSEHADGEEFFDKVIQLKSNSKKFIHVNLMNEYWNADQIPLYAQRLAEHNISYSIDPIDYSLQTRTHPIFIKGN
jgi:hypothetical protein